MLRSLILQYVPNADPRFVAVLEKAPDPPAVVRERVLQRLPDVYRAFLAKRRAEQAEDLEQWERAIEQEKQMIAACDTW